MSNYILTDSNGGIRVDVIELVKEFLDKYDYVAYNKKFFRFNETIGNWAPTTMCDIRDAIAEYLADNSSLPWSIRYRREAFEQIEVHVQKVEKMDISDTIICTSNAVVDVATGTIYDPEAVKELYLTVYIPVEYNPNAKCPKFNKFLRQVCCKKKLRRKTLEEFMGISLTKRNCPALVLVGNGANGKSVYADVLTAMLGEQNYTNAKVAELAGFGTGKIRGKRLALLSEISPKDSRYLMTTEMKQIVTGENMGYNAKYQALGDFRPYAKVLVLSNHMLQFDVDASEGVQRRILIIPCELQLNANKRDPYLKQKLLGEVSGILNLAIEGFQRLASNGYIFSSHKESTAMIRKKLRYANPIRTFIEEKIEFRSDSKISYATFRNEYRNWIIKNNMEIPENELKGIDGRTIKNELELFGNRELELFRSNGFRGVRGVKIKD